MRQCFLVNIYFRDLVHFPLLFNSIQCVKIKSFPLCKMKWSDSRGPLWWQIFFPKHKQRFYYFNCYLRQCIPDKCSYHPGFIILNRRNFINVEFIFPVVQMIFTVLFYVLDVAATSRKFSFTFAKWSVQ